MQCPMKFKETQAAGLFVPPYSKVRVALWVKPQSLGLADQKVSDSNPEKA